MSDIYGKDLKLVNGDIVFTPDGDVETIEGPACIAQDILNAIAILKGSLVWDLDAGSTIPLMLNDVLIDEDGLKSEIETVVLADPRVDPDSIETEVTIIEGRHVVCKITFVPLGYKSKENLVFDLDEVIKGEDL